MSGVNQKNNESNKSCRFFTPYKGEFYGTEKSILSKKMLIVGASHYCGDFDECTHCGITSKTEKCANFTCDIFDTFYSSIERPRWMRTYSAFANSVLGYDATLEDQCKFFQSVVFVNYLQRAEGEKGNEKHNSWFRNVQNADAFKQTITEYTPDVIVVWGARVWPALPWRDFIIDEAQSTGNVKKCSYQGKSFILMQVHHPSMGYVREKHLKLFREYEIFIIDPNNK